MFLFYVPDIEQSLRLPPEESKHCAKVLRKRAGDHIQITDGKGGLFTAQITSINPQECQVNLIDKAVAEKRPYSIHIAIAPTKNMDRIEWFIEKCTEIGIDKITLLQTKRTERTKVKEERLQRILTSAMKQSKEYYLPQLHTLVDYHTFVAACSENKKFIAYVDESGTTNELFHIAQKSDEYCVLIGPEGDFTPEEIEQALQNNFEPIALGPKRLRTETAGVAACHTLNLINY